ncbi:MAG: hypothetical protein SFX73_12125 [Kofleriaceae bacterium]|nr:hypothetical protein [Kofleriaceae bacterium]
MHLASSLRAVSVAAACLAPALAHANPAWNAAKTHLPGDVSLVVGVNVPELAKSSMVKMALSMGASDVNKAVDQLKRACNIDAWSALQHVVIALDEKHDNGIMFVAVKGIDVAKAGACFEAIARDDGEKDAKVTITTDGPITELATAKHKLYVMPIGKDVFAISTKADDKADLARWAPKNGAFAKSKTGKLAAKVNTKATGWFTSSKETELDGAKVKRAHGALVLKAGNLDADLRAGFGSVAEAKAAADKLNAELAAKPDAKAFLDKLSITSAKDEMVVKAKLPESELMQALSALM